MVRLLVCVTPGGREREKTHTTVSLTSTHPHLSAVTAALGLLHSIDKRLWSLMRSALHQLWIIPPAELRRTPSNTQRAMQCFRRPPGWLQDCMYIYIYLHEQNKRALQKNFCRASEVFCFWTDANIFWPTVTHAARNSHIHHQKPLPCARYSQLSGQIPGKLRQLCEVTIKLCGDIQLTGCNIG